MFFKGLLYREQTDISQQAGGLGGWVKRLKGLKEKENSQTLTTVR